jgi:hypothetical protein
MNSFAIIETNEGMKYEDRIMIDSSSSLFEDLNLSFEETGDLSWENISQSFLEDDDLSDMSSSNHSQSSPSGNLSSSSTHSSSSSSQDVYNTVSDYDYDDSDEFGGEEETIQCNNYKVVSSVACETRVANLGSLALCMEKSSVTRALIENFCKSTFKSQSTDPEPTLVGDLMRQTDIPSTISTTVSVAKTPSVKKSRKTIKKKKNNKKDPAFRLTGLKISEEKIKRLDAKLRLLDHQPPINAWATVTITPASSTTSSIADFLRQHKR